MRRIAARPAVCISSRLTVALAAFTLLAIVAAAGAAITGTNIAVETIWSRNIADNSVRSQDLQNNGIGSVDVANGSLLGADLRDGTITGAEIRNSTIEGADVRDGALGTRDIGDGSLTGEDLAAGSIGATHLSFDAATQAELDALAAPGFLNVPSNKVDWTQLKNVPAGFADGVDDTGAGAGAADVVCTGCVDSTDLANGSVAIGDLAYDPATQGELDAFATSLSAAGTINTGTNPVDWTKLKGVPAGLADGTDAVDGGTAADVSCAGCIAIAELAIDPATQAELDALAVAGTINTASNPVDWTKLKAVPAEIADGDDNVDGGVAADVNCTECIYSAELGQYSIVLEDFAFDPATQAELDALGTAGTINTGTNPVAWSKLKGVPAGVADGDDRTFVIGASTVGPGPVTITNGTFGTAEATCGSGDVAIGGSFTSDATGAISMVTSRVKPATTDTWEMRFYNATGVDVTVTPTAICIGDVADA